MSLKPPLPPSNNINSNTPKNEINGSIKTTYKQLTLKDYSILVTGYMKYSKPFILTNISFDIISLCATFISFIDIDSKILNNENELKFYDCIVKGINRNETIKSLNKLNIKLLYRGTIDGFIGFNMYFKCENKSRIILLVKNTNKHIFGGYTSKRFGFSNLDDNLERFDKFAFMFSIYPNANIYPPVDNWKDAWNSYQIDIRRHEHEFFSYFGDKFIGLMLWGGCNENWKSYCDIRAKRIWKNFDAKKIVGDDTLTYFGNCCNFQVEEIEAFHLELIK